MRRPRPARRRSRSPRPAARRSARAICGKGRILLDRHAQQGEARGSAADGDLAVFGRELHRCVRQPAGDVGEQSPGDECGSRLVDLGRDLGARRDLVVERRERDDAVALASSSTPLRIGWVVRCGRSLTAKETASLKTSRFTWNFTTGTPLRRNRWGRLILPRVILAQLAFGSRLGRQGCRRAGWKKRTLIVLTPVGTVENSRVDPPTAENYTRGRCGPPGGGIGAKSVGRVRAGPIEFPQVGAEKSTGNATVSAGYPHALHSMCNRDLRSRIDSRLRHEVRCG